MHELPEFADLDDSCARDIVARNMLILLLTRRIPLSNQNHRIPSTPASEPFHPSLAVPLHLLELYLPVWSEILVQFEEVGWECGVFGDGLEVRESGTWNA